MWVGRMADLHHVIGEQHLVGDGLRHTGPESDKSSGRIFVVGTKCEHLKSSFCLKQTSNRTSGK